MATRVAFEGEDVVTRTDSLSSANKVRVFASLGDPSMAEEKEASGREKDKAATTTVGVEAKVALPSTRYEHFYDVFGSIGVPMVICFVLSAGVSFCFAAMQIFPLEAMNLLMDTGTLDHGHFWIPAETSRSIKCLAALALALFGVGYIWLILFMITFRSTVSLDTREKRASPAAATTSAPASPSRSSLTYLITKKATRTKPSIRSRVAASDSSESRNSVGEEGTVVSKPGTRRLFWRWLRKAKRREFTSITGVYHHYYVRASSFACDRDAGPLAAHSYACVLARRSRYSTSRSFSSIR